ncbi:MAG: carbohydrate ABC transporter permease [Armatimonadetes bacterium]|nr:carbohydrate ABC transporter permease [Armatimonadota bacterium]
MKRNLRESLSLYGILLIGGLVMAFPFYYMVVTSLKSGTEANLSTPTLFVKSPTVEAYRDLLQNDLVYRSAFNSFAIALIQTLGSLFFCTLAGYAFAKHQFAGKNFLFLLLLATMMIPGAVLLVPGFLLFRDFGWLDTWAPLIVPGLGGAFGVFLARQFIEKIPNSLIEAAHLQGCSEFMIYWRMIVPLSKPLIATLAILTFLGSWNSFLGPLLYLLNEKLYTLPLVISLLQGRFPGRDNVQMAGAVISIVPVLILFFILQKQVVESLAHTGLKDG